MQIDIDALRDTASPLFAEAYHIGWKLQHTVADDNFLK
jgi:hypothetical protein